MGESGATLHLDDTDSISLSWEFITGREVYGLSLEEIGIMGIVKHCCHISAERGAAGIQTVLRWVC